MDDALLAQFQKAQLEEHDDRDRIEPETDDELEEEEEEEVTIYYFDQLVLTFCSRQA
jgi:Mg2+ and Co2+ transporter CorA